MESMGQSNLEIARGLRAALTHAGHFFLEAVFRDVFSCFMNCKNSRMVLFGERERVSEMVTVSMREKNCVELRDFFQGFGASGVCGDPGIDERDLAGGRCEGKGTVAEVDDAIAFGVEHFFGSPAGLIITWNATILLWRLSRPPQRTPSG